MMMKVFSHGTGAGGNPTRYLIRTDYPGRDEHPPQVLRGDPALTRALIDSIDRRWKFTAGVLAWHPDDRVSEAQEEAVMDDFERVAFAGLEPDQRNILWVRHTHAGHHELHFLIPRLELSGGKDFNACPPGWQKDFDVFRDLWNWREGWARPDDPARKRDSLPPKADLFKARMARWGKTIHPNDRDKLKAAIHELLKKTIPLDDVQSRADVVRLLQGAGLRINRAGKDYLSVIEPESGLKVRFRGGFYAENWTPASDNALAVEDEAEEEQRRQKILARLRRELELVLAKRRACNEKRYPSRWASEDAAFLNRLHVHMEMKSYDGNGTDADADAEKNGEQRRCNSQRIFDEAGTARRRNFASGATVTAVKRLVQLCTGYLQQIAQTSPAEESPKITTAPEQCRRMRM